MYGVERLRQEWIHLYKKEKFTAKERRAYHIYVLATQGVKPEEPQQN